MSFRTPLSRDEPITCRGVHNPQSSATTQGVVTTTFLLYSADPSLLSSRIRPNQVRVPVLGSCWSKRRADVPLCHADQHKERPDRNPRHTTFPLLLAGTVIALNGLRGCLRVRRLDEVRLASHSAM
jgi:hypothetical protein